jgi:hypothetical protein
MLTQERLKELLNYDPKTGLFTRLTTRNNKCKKGSIAGCSGPKGYIMITIDFRSYLGHRLAWFYMTGEWPDKVDHEDGVTHHNWWSNLRNGTNSQNMQNQKKAMASNKSSGLLGVSARGKYGYEASITRNGVYSYLGTFKTKEKAHEKYLEAKRNLHEFNTL